MIGITNCNVHMTEFSKVSILTAPIPSTYIFNSLSDSKRISSNNLLKANNYDDLYYNNSIFLLMEKGINKVQTDIDNDYSHNNDSKKEMSDDSNDNKYNEYSRYNEYGEYDRGYYYCDGRYERKTSSMISS